MRVLGLISGTSTDGVDAAVADLSLSADVVRLVPVAATSTPYPDDLRAALEAALPPAITTVEDVCVLDTRVGQAFADAAAAAIAAAGPVDLVVSHGQTLYHWVEGRHARGTLQIGQPAWIAERTGAPVVADLRARDVAAGGHGAPLVSRFDALLLGGGDRVRAALNLGGIANLTVLAPGRPPLAFDTGPANTLVDAAVHDRSGGAASYDRDGAWAARGRVDEGLLGALLADPYYALAPPKSTGRERFNRAYLHDALHDRPRVADADLLATLTALTAETVACACRDHDVAEVVAAGGGTANPTLLGMLRERLPGVALTTIDDHGVPADAKEAYAFALLGFLTVHGVAGSEPSCTGAAHPTLLGALVPGRDGFALPPPAAVVPTRLEIVV